MGAYTLKINPITGKFDLVGKKNLLLPAQMRTASNEAVSVGGTTIAFPAGQGGAVSTANYVIVPSCRDAAGNFITFTILNETVNGFDVDPAVNGFFDYVAIDV